MASETSFSVVDSGGSLGLFWRSLGDLWLFGWLGNLWFSIPADTLDLASNEISRHGLPGGQRHHEVPYALW